MPHETIKIEAKDASTVHVLVGTLLEVYEEELRTADVNIDGHGVVEKIPIFYHCQNMEEGVDGGSEVATGGNPFIPDDRVLIVNYGDAVSLSVANMKVIGYEDGLPRECGFQFKLIRDDGTIIDSPEYEWATIFSCRNASGQNFAPENVVYNEETQYWSFNIPGFARDVDGYWIRFVFIEDSIDTVYPYKYKTADKYQEADLIKPGKYEAAVPYWRTESSAVAGTIECDGNELAVDFISGVAKEGAFIFLNGGAYELKRNVKSSIPYKVTWNTRDNSTRTKRAVETWTVADYRIQWEDCCLMPPEYEDCVPVPEICCWEYTTPYARCYLGNRSGGPFTLVANSINLTITDDPISIETDTAEFSGSIGGSDHIATISGGGSEPEPSPICEAGRLVYYPGYAPLCHDRVCENAGNAPFDYTHWYPGVYNCVSILVSYDY